MTLLAVDDTENTKARRSRLRAFVSNAEPDAFRSVLAMNDIWMPDPYDVDSINAFARETFERIVARASNGGQLGSAERILLVFGDSGSGKTHLMRAFRNKIHSSARGFFSYMQMRSGSGSYESYILQNVIDSLDRPYNYNEKPETGLEYLSRSLLQEARLLGDHSASGNDDGDIDVFRAAVSLVRSGKFRVDNSILAALLQIQRQDPFVTQVATKFLRCAPMLPFEIEALGGLSSAPSPHASLTMIKSIADTIKFAFGVPLIICFDQLEDFFVETTEGARRFVELVSAINALAQNENIVIVVSILEMFYSALSIHIPEGIRAPLETVSKPVHLEPASTADEVYAILRKRLDAIFCTAEVEPAPDGSLEPFARETVSRLTSMPHRSVVRLAGEARERAIREGLGAAEVIEIAPSAEPSLVAPSQESVADLKIEQQWNDFRSAFPRDVLDDGQMLDLLERVLPFCARERPEIGLRCERKDGIFRLHLDARRASACVKLVTGKLAGGQLARQLDTFRLECRSLGLPGIALRNGEFSVKKNKATENAGLLVKDGGQCVSMQPTDWNTCAAYLAFSERRKDSPEFDRWVLEHKALTSLPGIFALLRLSETAVTLESTAKSGELPESNPPRQEPADTDSPAADSGIKLGKAKLSGLPFAVVPHDLKRHAAILGESGSGKTVLAVSLIEALLDRGVPALLIDKKGDLSSFADPAHWQRADLRADLAERRKRLRERVDISLYTPGRPDGRNLSIRALPTRLDAMSAPDRELEILYAANGIATLLGYPESKTDRRALLVRAIEALIEQNPTGEATLQQLSDFIFSRDPRLLAALQRLDDGLIKTVSKDLYALLTLQQRLLSSDSEEIDIEKMLGIGAHHIPGRTRLAIVNTAGLQDGVEVEFWLSRLFVDLMRYAIRKPSDSLQALLFVDEADKYLPPTRKPATKGPLLDLFRRARSAGIAVVVGSQSPGDFDYSAKINILTWFAGKISQQRALEKLRLNFSDAAAAVDGLPSHAIGEFLAVTEGSVGRFLSDLPAIIPTQLTQEAIVTLAAAGRP